MVLYKKAILADTIIIQIWPFDKYPHCFLSAPWYPCAYQVTLFRCFAEICNIKLQHGFCNLFLGESYFVFILWWVKPKFSHVHTQKHTHTKSHGCTSSWPSMGRDVWLINEAFINTRIGKRPPKSTYISARHFYPSSHEHDLRRQSMRSAAYTWLHNEMVS